MKNVQSNQESSSFWDDRGPAKATAITALVIFVAAVALSSYLGYGVCPQGFNVENLLNSVYFDATFITGCSVAVIGTAATIYYITQGPVVQKSHEFDPFVAVDELNLINQMIFDLKNTPLAIECLKLLDKKSNIEGIEEVIENARELQNYNLSIGLYRGIIQEKKLGSWSAPLLASFASSEWILISPENCKIIGNTALLVLAVFQAKSKIPSEEWLDLVAPEKTAASMLRVNIEELKTIPGALDALQKLNEENPSLEELDKRKMRAGSLGNDNKPVLGAKVIDLLGPLSKSLFPLISKKEPIKAETLKVIGHNAFLVLSVFASKSMISPMEWNELIPNNAEVVKKQLINERIKAIDEKFPKLRGNLHELMKNPTAFEYLDGLEKASFSNSELKSKKELAAIILNASFG